MTSPLLDDALYEGEYAWVKRYDALKEQGYLLRARYRPGWVASWKTDPKLPREDCEDSIPIGHRQVLDARRISDGKTVILKACKRESNETKILKYLSSPGVKEDPDNHAIPLLTTLDDPVDPEGVLLVTPMLRHADSPRFISVQELTEFIQQILYALVFLHARGVAHRDYQLGNFMMDGRAMYPESWHPMAPHRTVAGDSLAQHRSRSAVGGIRYYVIDFEFATLHVGSHDLQAETWDVRLLARTLKKYFYDEYEDMDWLKPFIETMDRDPAPGAADPTAVEASELFKRIRVQADSGIFWKRLHHKRSPDGPFGRASKDLFYKAQQLSWVLTPKVTLPPLA